MPGSKENVIEATTTIQRIPRKLPTTTSSSVQRNSRVALVGVLH